MELLTLGSLRTTIAEVLNTDVTDSRIRDRINECQDRLITQGNWTGVYLRYEICTSESCLVWPRQIENIEAVAICKRPGIVRNDWFEFLGTGPGILDSDDSIAGSQLMDRGTSPTFDWVSGTGKYVKVYSSAEDAGKKIQLRYYDENGQKVYSSIGGTWQEGEQLTLVAPPAYATTTSTVMARGLYQVIKDTTKKPVLLYEYDGASITKTLAQYEPFETNPIYRVSMIPGLSNYGGCGDPVTCTTPRVTVMARLRHIPVVVDSDPLVLGCRAAFKLMAMSISEEMARNDDRALLLEQRAIKALRDELMAHLGDGPVVQVRMANPQLFGGGDVPGLIRSW